MSANDVWQLGRDADRAIAIGVGAGAFGAFLVGTAPVVSAIVLMLVQGPEVEKAAVGLQKTAASLKNRISPAAASQQRVKAEKLYRAQFRPQTKTTELPN